MLRQRDRVPTTSGSPVAASSPLMDERIRVVRSGEMSKLCSRTAPHALGAGRPGRWTDGTRQGCPMQDPPHRRTAGWPPGLLLLAVLAGPSAEVRSQPARPPQEKAEPNRNPL